MRSLLLASYFLFGMLSQGGAASAADIAPVVLTIKNKQFDPQNLPLPSGVKLKMLIRNLDEIPAEFESYDLSREVVVPAHGEVNIYIGPLEQGNYQFINDFNHDMHGSIEVMPALN